MGRVEPSNDRRQTEQRRGRGNERQPARDAAQPNPSKAEGDEKVVDEALRHQEEKRQS